ncbi:hypothetical protein EXN66_Car009943 [Channa argus]|uniref:Uncharacterized protein n=1 Tax=Channa argus TaxID=215402 RepID=A0A6G1PVK1_CHAAH|nr:hypothetical protein EXN66_Car009943 [Channa argus]
MRMLINREQMSLEQTHHPTPSKKQRRKKTKHKKINIQFVFRLNPDEDDRKERKR